MLLAVLALASLAQAVPFDGAAFSLQAPAGIRVTEAGNGSYFFTEARRAGRAEDDADPTLKLLVIPGGGGFAPAVLVDALIGDFTPRFAMAGCVASESVALTRAIAGSQVAGKRVDWLRDGTLAWSCEVFAWNAGANVVGLVTKAAGGALAAEQAEIAAMLEGLEGKPFTADTERRMGVGFAELPVPAVAQVQEQSAAQESLSVLTTAQGRIFLHWIGDCPFGTDYTVTSLLQKSEEEIKAQAQQAGAAYLGAESFVHLWQDRLVPGRCFRLRLADGTSYSLRMLTFVVSGQVLQASVEVNGAGAATALARLDAIAAAVPLPADETPARWACLDGCRVDNPLPLTVSWSDAGDEMVLRLANAADAPETTLTLRPVPAGAAAPDAAQYAAALRARWYPDAELISAEDAALTWMDAAQPAHLLRLRRDGAEFVVRASLARSGERAVLAGMRGRADDDHDLARAWEEILGTAAWLPVEGGLVPIVTPRLNFGLPAAGWRLSAQVSAGLSVLEAAGDGFEVAMDCSEFLTGADAETLAAGALEDVKERSGGEEAAGKPGFFRATRLFGAAAAAVCGGAVTTGGAQKDLVVYRMADAMGDLKLRVTGPPAADAAARAGIDALLASLEPTDPIVGDSLRIGAGGVACDVPAGFTVDETYDGDATILNLRPLGSQEFLISLSIFEDARDEAAAAELAFLEEDIAGGYLAAHTATVREEEQAAVLAATGPVPCVRFRGRGAADRPDRDAWIAAVAFPPAVASVKISGLASAVRESLGAALAVVNTLRPDPLVVHHGGAEASLAWDRAEISAEVRLPADGGAEFLLHAGSGEELRCRHADGAWSTTPARGDVRDPALAAAASTLSAAAQAGAARDWSNEILRCQAPTAGRLTPSAKDLVWECPEWRARVRVRWWTGAEGQLDLHETLSNLAEAPDDASWEEGETWRVLRTLAGRPVQGAARLWRSDEAPAGEEYHIYALRWRGMDLAVNASFPADGDGRGRAAAELMLGSLRFASQPQAAGQLVQVGHAALVLPWHALAVFESRADEDQILVTLGMETASLLLWIDPDTEEGARRQEQGLTAIVGENFPAGSPVAQRFLGRDFDGEQWDAGSIMRRFVVTQGGWRVQWISGYLDAEAFAALGAAEAAAAASLLLD